MGPVVHFRENRSDMQIFLFVILVALAAATISAFSWALVVLF